MKKRKDEVLYDQIVDKLAKLYGILPDEISRALTLSTIHVAALEKWHSSIAPKKTEEEKE